MDQNQKNQEGQAPSNEAAVQPPGHGGHQHEYKIQIDRVHYTVTAQEMTGNQLRHVPATPIGPDRDLFEVVPGGTDRKIGDSDLVEIRDGKRFFTAPAQINPGK